MKIMAVDLGDARTGLAVCDQTEYLASPAGMIEERNFEAIVNKVMNAATESGAEMIVVGYPRNMDGSAGSRAQKCAEFARSLQDLVSIPVELWDERSTTVMAHNYLNETNTRGKKRKKVIDQVAATIILDSYLAYRRNKKGETNNEYEGLL